MVRRLVEDHRLRVGEEDARELDASALSPRQGLERLIEDAVRKRQVVRDRRGLRLGGVTPERLEPLHELPVPAHRLRGDVGVVVGHRERGLLHAERDAPQSACVEDARPRELLGIAATGILRKVAELPRAFDASRGGQQVAREHLRERRLSGAVATDQPHLVAVADAEGDVGHQDARADPDLEIMHGEHNECPFR